MRAILLFVLVFVSVTVHAQPPDSLWSHTYGGAGDDVCKSILQTDDGGYLLAGYTNSFGSGDYDYWVVKTDAQGNELWNRTYGGDSSDVCVAAVKTLDGGYALAGTTKSFGAGPAGSENMWLLKISADGDSLWSRALHYTESITCTFMIQDSAQGFILVGYSGWNKTCLAKISMTGDSLWFHAIQREGFSTLQGTSVSQLPNGRLFLTCNAFLADQFQSGAATIITNSLGNFVSINTNVNGWGNFQYYSIARNLAGNMIIAGEDAAFGHWPILFCENDIGVLQWQVCLFTYNGFFNQVHLDSMSIVSAGSRIDTIPQSDFWLVKTNASADTVWTKSFGGTGDEICNDFLILADRSYIMAGNTNSFGAGNNDFWLLKTTPASLSPGINVSRNAISFKPAARGETHMDSVIIVNSGNADLSISNIVVPSGFTTDSLMFSVIPPNDRRVLHISFVPNEIREYIENVNIISNSPDSPTLIGVSGACLDMPYVDWTRCYNNSFPYTSTHMVKQTFEGEYILAGECPIEGHYDIRLERLNSAGQIIWNRSYNLRLDDRCASVMQTSDGGFLASGSSNDTGISEDFCCIKTDQDGGVIWSRTYGGNASDVCTAAIQSSDGGYVLAGNTRSFGNNTGASLNFWLLAISEIGDSLWSRTYGGTNEDACNAIQQLSDGSYLLAGSTHTWGETNYDFLLVKTNTLADTLWTRTYGGTGRDECTAVGQTPDGGYFLAGSTTSFGAGGKDFWLVRTDANGNELWNHTYGSAFDDICYSAQMTSDGGFVLAGSTLQNIDCYGDHREDFWAVKTDANGNCLWARDYSDIRIHWDIRNICKSIQITSDNGFILGGDATTAESCAPLLLKLTPFLDTPVVVLDLPQPAAYSLSQNYPNPFNPETRIRFDLPVSGKVSLKVYNILGRQVMTLANGAFTAGSHEVTFDGANLPSGIYIYRLQTANFSSNRKMMLIK
jgi:uncharacterized delta-60 repeat protein